MCGNVSSDMFLCDLLTPAIKWLDAQTSSLNSCDNNTQQPFYGPLSGTTRVSRYQKKHSPTHHPDHHPIFFSFFHLPRSIGSSLFKLRASQSFCTTFLHVLFGHLLVWSPPPHTPYISSPNQCLLFATHAHTIATCFAVVSIFMATHSNGQAIIFLPSGFYLFILLA